MPTPALPGLLISTRQRVAEDAWMKSILHHNLVGGDRLQFLSLA